MSFVILHNDLPLYLKHKQCSDKNNFLFEVAYMIDTKKSILRDVGGLTFERQESKVTGLAVMQHIVIYYDAYMA